MEIQKSRRVVGRIFDPLVALAVPRPTCSYPTGGKVQGRSGTCVRSMSLVCRARTMHNLHEVLGKAMIEQGKLAIQHLRLGSSKILPTYQI
jgi:hypothetical protein